MSSAENENAANVQKDDILDSGFVVAKNFGGHVEDVLDVLFCPWKNLVISCAYDSSIRYWNFETCECLKVNKSHNDTVRSLVGLKDDPRKEDERFERFLSCSRDGTIVIHSVDSMEPVRLLFDSKHDTLVQMRKFNICRLYQASSQTVIAINFSDDAFALLDVDEGFVKEFKCKIPIDFTSVMMRSKNYKDCCYVNCAEKCVKLFDYGMDQIRYTFDEHEKYAESISTFCNHEKVEMLLISSDGRSLFIYNTVTKILRTKIETEGNSVRAYTFSNQYIVNFTFDEGNKYDVYVDILDMKKEEGNHVMMRSKLNETMRIGRFFSVFRNEESDRLSVFFGSDKRLVLGTVNSTSFLFSDSVEIQDLMERVEYLRSSFVENLESLIDHTDWIVVLDIPSFSHSICKSFFLL